MDFFEVMLQETLSGGGGGDEPTGTVDIVQNGVTNVKSYASANVQVPNSYGVEDEGKVVSNGVLVAQGSLTITENDTYDTTLKNEVVVSVSGGGGSDADFEIDFTKIQKTNHDVTFDSDGAKFNTTTGFFSIQDLVDFYYDTNNGITIELDIASMQLPSSSSHQRFVMGDDSDGLIFRSTGVWAFYSSTWQDGTFEGANDGSFFDNCTLKIYRDTSLKWHFYKDGVLFFEPSKTLGLNTARIGSSSQSIQNAVITKLRVYKGQH